jgi:hypothetical protein
MPIPISYSYRNLLARWLTTFLTAVGMALVVFVFAAELVELVGRESEAHPAFLHHCIACH